MRRATSRECSFGLLPANAEHLTARQYSGPYCTGTVRAIQLDTAAELVANLRAGLPT